MPTEFQKEVATTTAKVYKSYLNKFAANGLDTVQLIQTEQKKVIDIIKQIEGDDEIARQKRRAMLSAIFWAIPLPKKNQYYVYWQTTIPRKALWGSHEGENWKKRKDYVE